ncbi:MAG TPA: hypothetical protein VJJ55_02835 [Candidatus Paceibacterota bacterium]
MTATIIIYRLAAEPDKLFAHCVHSEAFEVNEVPVLNAEATFYASIPAGESPESDRVAAKRFALAEQRWPLKLPVHWGDTGEVWEV